MIHVLEHGEPVARHRHRTLMEIGLASALFHALGAESVNLFQVQNAGEQLLLHRLTHVGADGLRFFDTDFETSDQVVALGARDDFRCCVTDERIVFDAEPDAPRGTCCLPVAYDGKVAGLVEIRGIAAPADAQLALALALVGDYRSELSRLDDAEHDPLTGLLNRPAFDANLARIVHSLASPAVDPALLPGQDRRDPPGRARAPHWLAVIDVDRFRRINDAFGYLYGDEVLVLLAGLMRTGFRFEDKLFRFGGEAFVAVLKPGPEAGIRGVLERFRATVEAQHFPQVGQVTVSIGCAPLHPGDTAASALAAAEDALAYAKRHGRNQVCSHPALVVAGELPPPG
jgi:diguanylate cyclase (GGDEF)-like protein